jgi:hypothetical protein
MLIGPWLVHSVTRKRRTGVSSRGDPTFGSASTVRARVERKRTMVRDAGGKEVVSSARMALLDEPRLDDLYWLPSIGGETADDTTSDDAARSPLSIEVATNQTGNQKLWMVYFP